MTQTPMKNVNLTNEMKSENDKIVTDFTSFDDNNSSTLRRRLLLTLLPTALIPLIIAGGLGYKSVQDKETIRIKNQLENQALLTGEVTLQTINEAQKIPATMAHNPLIVEAVKNLNTEIKNQNILNIPPVELENKYQQNKLVLVNNPLNDYLQKSVNQSGLGSLLITQSDGFNVAYSNSASKVIHKNENWWQQAKSKNQAVNSTDNAYGLILSQSIKDPQTGAFLGVIQGTLPARRFNFISEYLRKAGLTGSQILQVFIPSKKQEILTINKDETKTNQPILGEEEVIKLGNSMLKAIADPNLITEMDLTNFNNESGITPNLTPLSGENGEEILMAAFTYQGRQYTIATIPQTNWIASASMDVREINAAGSALISVFGIVEFVLFLIVTGVILTLANNISQPLQELSQGAEKVAKGDLDVRVKPQGSIETKTLATTFNKLVMRISDLLKTQERATQEALLLAEISSFDAKNEGEKDDFFNEILAKLRDYLTADRVVIYRFQNDNSGYISNESVGENLPSALLENINDPCIPEKILEDYLSDRVVATKDVFKAGFHPDHFSLLERLEIKSNLVVPIISENKLFGLLIIHHCKNKHDWVYQEIDFVKEVAIILRNIQERVSFLTQIAQGKQEAEKLAQEQKQLKEQIQRRALELLMEIDPVSKGDLTIRATVTADEIGTLADSYNATIQSLNKIVTQVKNASQQVGDTTSKNELMVQDLSLLSQQQTEEMEQALTKLQAMAQSIALVTENAENAQITVQEATKTVKMGDEVMNQTVDSILAITDTVSTTAEKVKMLGESSQRISKVVKLIGNFASQTNLLALNASIEAAHAGEQGRGFAVVADEVRELASQSAKATAEIAGLVDEIQRETQEVVKAMEEGTDQVLQGTFLVEQAKSLLTQISKASLKINDSVEAIALAASEQSQDSEVVTNTMGDVVEIAQKTSVSAKNVSQSFEQLLIVSQELQETVGKFKIN